MKFALIAAIGKNRELGLDGDIPWHIKGDQKKFKEITMGSTLIMGRKTYLSIGRPLPGRKSVVITRSFEKDSLPYGDQVFLARDFDEAFYLAQDMGEDIFVIGGSSVYAKAYPYCSDLYISHVDYEGAADVYFPDINLAAYEVVAKEDHAGNDDQKAWTFVHYRYKD